ncbi:MAG: response regulator [Anaerolineae bacterium]|jgi:CheY-like chemotaxis protein/AraC-like DNA-binding protein
MLTSDQFLEHLRSALNHLYDPDHLRRSPLAPLFGVEGRFDSPYALQRILTDSIEDLEPDAGAPGHSPARQVYELLFYRYVQQFSQQEVADQLGMSARHLRRKQHAALEMLACRLWEQFRLESKVTEGADTETAVGPATPSVNEELAWLKNAPRDSSTDLEGTLSAVLDLARPLVAQHGARLALTKPDRLPAVAVHPAALRQTLLSLLTVAVGRSRGRRVDISIEQLQWEVQVRVQGASVPEGLAAISDDNKNSLQMARWLTDLCQARLSISTDASSFDATLTLPALERMPVLVIDDNADTLQLLQRYASSTRYRLISTGDPAQAIDLAEEFAPQVIVLDVMMPDVDGWEVLGRLRHHPAISGTPIIVCTILAQEDLALALGASSFIRKPVSRRGFLAALDRQVAQRGPEHR